MAERETEAARGGQGEGDFAPQDKAKAGLRPALDDARHAVRNLADQQRHKVASRLGGVARALHDTAESLERQNATAGRYATLAAERLERLTETLQERPIEDLVGEAERLARRQPTLFLTGALAAGFALARLVKSGQPERITRETAGIGQPGAYASGEERYGNTPASAYGVVAGSAAGTQMAAPDTMPSDMISDDLAAPAAGAAVERAQQASAGVAGTGGVEPRTPPTTSGGRP